LKTLEQSVDDEADFSLGLEKRAGEEQSTDREEALHRYSLGKKNWKGESVRVRRGGSSDAKPRPWSQGLLQR